MSRNSFWGHVEELRKTLIYSGCALFIGMATAFYFHTSLFTFFLAPLGLQKLYFLSPLEGFATAIKLSCWVGLLIAAPFVLYFVLRFFVPALYPRERRLLAPFLVLSLLFMGGGVLFAYRITVPLMVRFFETFNVGIGENLWSVRETVDLIMGLLLAHALVFELYVGLLFAIQLRLLSYSLLRKGRRGVILGIFILAMLVTPPDVLSQLLLAIPMLALFELALLYAKLRMLHVER